MNALILASRSPRRCELLRRTGFSFETDAPDVDETCSLPVAEAVQLLSQRKASAAASFHPGSFILAADTLVSFQGETLGKPVDEADAVRMLSLLSGRTHQVYTGVTVISSLRYVKRRSIPMSARENRWTKPAPMHFRAVPGFGLSIWMDLIPL